MNTYTEKLIRAGVEGKWKPFGEYDGFEWDGESAMFWKGDNCQWKDVSEALLDPDFWEAPGKTLGWSKRVCNHCGGSGSKCCGALRVQITCMEGWKYQMHAIIQSRIDGLSIEQFAKTLFVNKK